MDKKGSAELVVVEDDPTDRLLIREMLEDGRALGMSLAECGNLAAARELIGSETICVLIDNLLPDGLGMDLLAKLREEWPGLSIIMLTGSGDELTSVDALKRGANDYLPKHKMSPGLLRDTIIGAVDKMRLAEVVRVRDERLALLGELTDAAEDLLFVVDCLDESIVLANAATRRALGRTEQDLDGHPSPVSNLFKAGYASWSALRGVLARRSPVRFETTVWAGGYFGRPVEISARIVMRGGRQFVIGIGRDILEQRRLQTDLLRFAALDPQTELPTQPAFAQQLERWATEHPAASSRWMLCAAQVPAVLLSTSGSAHGALVHARVRIARLVAEFVTLHGGLAGLASNGAFLAAVPVEDAATGREAIETLADALLQEIRAQSLAEVASGPQASRAPVGVGALAGTPLQLSGPEALRRVAGLADESLIARGRLQWGSLDGAAG